MNSFSGNTGGSAPNCLNSDGGTGDLQTCSALCSKCTNAPLDLDHRLLGLLLYEYSFYSRVGFQKTKG